MLLLERPDGLKIIRVTQPEEAVAYRHAFAGAYQDIWSDPPYRQRLFPSEAIGAFDHYLQTPEQVMLLAVRSRAQVVGFAVAVPASSIPHIARELRGLIPVPHSTYLAELGVLEGYRGLGLGSQLIDQRMALIDRHRYTHVLSRTSTAANSAYDIYLKNGFDDMGLYTEVSARRTDGTVKTDRRVFLCRTLLAEDHSTETVEGATWNADSEQT